MRIIAIRENPEYKERAVEYFSNKWGVSREIYDDCITHSIDTDSILPHWYLLEEEGEIIGCAGLVTNDFISRMDLYPWLCALYIEETYRGNSLGVLLIEKAKQDAKASGFHHIYLSTDHIGYYEKYGFHYLGTGYHPWNESSRIYEIEL